MSEPGPLASVHEEARRLRRRALFAVTAGGVGAAGGVVLLLTLVPPRTLAAPAAFLSVAASGLFVAAIVGAASAAYRVFRRLTARRLAIEDAVPARLGSGDLLAALELEGGRWRGSPSLAGEHVTRVARSVGGLDATGLFPRTALLWRRRLLLALTSTGLVVMLLGLSALTRPEATKAAAVAAATPWRAVLRAPRSSIRVHPGHAQVARGDSLMVRVRAPGRSSVRLVWHVHGEARSGRDVAIAPDGAGSESIPSIVAPTRYWVEGADGASSDTFGIRPLDPLLIEELHAVLSYPLYLGRPSDSLAAPLPVLVVPAGTRVELSGRANHDLAEIGLTFRSHQPGRGDTVRPGAHVDRAEPAARFAVDSQRFHGWIQPVASGSWSWRLRAVGAPGKPVRPASIEALVIPDSLPRVQVLFPAADTALPGEVVLPLVGEARDDIGLRAIELVSWMASAVGPGAGQRIERIGPERAGDSRALVRALLDLRDRGLLPGDTVYYALRARDANPTHPAAISDTFRVWLPSLGDLGVKRAEQVQELARSTAAIETVAGDLERAAREEARRTTSPETGDATPRAPRREPEAGAATTPAQAALVDRGEELRLELRELRDEVERLRSELRGSVSGDPLLEQALAELSEEWEQGTSALESASRDLEDRRRANDAAGVREAVDRLSEEARALRDELRTAGNRLEMKALELSLKASRSQVAELAARQEAATHAPARDADWSVREEGLAEETEALADRLDGLRARLERSGAREPAELSRQAGQRVARAGEQMREAVRAASGEQRESDTRAPAGADPDQGEEPDREGAAPEHRWQAAERQAGAAAENLQRAADALGAAGAELSGKINDTALKTLARARTEALQLAGEEQSLLDSRPGGTARGRQAALRQGLDNLVRSLARAQEAGAVNSRALTKQTDAAARAMEAAIERMSETGRTHAAAQAYQDAIAALNELALQLLREERSRSAASAGSAGEEARRRMSELAEQQGGITERTRTLLPSGAEAEDVRPQAEKLARDQARIADQLEALGRTQDEMLGEPEVMAREAREITERLAAGRLDSETLSRQRRLFRRMLDAGRSLEQGELDSERRESRTGQAIFRDVPELDPRHLAGPRFPLPESGALGKLPPYYRRLVLDYFNRLNDNQRVLADRVPGQHLNDEERAEGQAELPEGQRE